MVLSKIMFHLLQDGCSMGRASRISASFQGSAGVRVLDLQQRPLGGPVSANLPFAAPGVHRLISYPLPKMRPK